MSSENINPAATPARPIIINVRFSADEKSSVVLAANNQHLQISTFIRQAAMQAAERVNADALAAS